MPHTKTPGGQQPSEKFLKEQEQTQGLGAPNAPGRTEGKNPLNEDVAGDSGPASNVGITEINNLSANKSGAFPNREGTQNVGVGAPTNNVPPEQNQN